jgi:hypothetical protein
MTSVPSGSAGGWRETDLKVATAGVDSRPQNFVNYLFVRGFENR